MIDPTGFLLTTIRDFPAVAALTTRVRCPEPMGKLVTDAGVVIDVGDERGAGKWIRFIVLSQIGRLREKRVPVQEVRYVARCYGQGVNPSQDATALAGAVSDAIHNRKPRANAAGVLIWASFDDGGDAATKDPDTGQPMVPVVISVTAATVPMI